MSIYNNSKIIVPLFNKIIKQKNLVFLWNLKKYHIKQSKHYLINNISFNQLRSIHLTNISNKIISFNLSDIGEGIREVVVKEWYVKEGDKVAQFDNICEVQSDKASVTITSRYDGVISKLYHRVDDIVLVGTPLVDIDTPESEVLDAVDNKTEFKPKILETIPLLKNVHSENNISNRGIAIPSVRRIAKENKINLTDIKGTGKDGRILKEDILSYIEKHSKPKTVTQKNVQIDPIRGYTRVMIKTMTEAMKIPHFVYHDEIRVSNLCILKEKLQQKSNKIDAKITYLPFFLKAASNALFQYPVLNARLDDKQENIIYNKSHNIAIAMDTPSGLAVPVIKNIQDKDIITISKEIIKLQMLGKESKFSQEDLSDGTFTFSNIGAIGGTYAKPIILPPQSAIMALGAFQVLPRFALDGTIKRETISYISAAADHRIIDGATMARFCNFIKQQIEDPEYLLLNI